MTCQIQMWRGESKNILMIEKRKCFRERAQWPQAFRRRTGERERRFQMATGFLTWRKRQKQGDLQYYSLEERKVVWDIELEDRSPKWSYFTKLGLVTKHVKRKEKEAMLPAPLPSIFSFLGIKDWDPENCLSPQNFSF